MFITYWYGPPQDKIDAETYADIRNAGFTVAGPMECSGSTPEDNNKFLDVCAEQGLKACVYDGRVNTAMQKYRDGAPDWREPLQSMAKDYKDHPALYSYYVYDEPQAGMFQMLGDVVRVLQESDPEHPGYINLLPNYATPDQLGTPTYYDYVKQYIEIVKPAFVSYDHYHFLHFAENEVPQNVKIEETEDERENAIRRSAMVNVNRAGFFENLEIVRELSLQYNLPFMVIVLLIEHGPYRNLTENEIRYEAFQTLAYGASMLSYFTYWTVIEPGSWWNWRNGCISCEGEKLQHYYDVQNVNREVHRYASYLEGRKSLSVSHYGEIDEKVTHFTGKIAAAQPVQLTIGEFEGGYTAIANKNVLHAAEFTMEFDCPVEKLDIESNRFVPLESNHLQIGPGDLVLLRKK